MKPSRKPVSLAASVLLGLSGAALLVIAGSTSAGAAAARLAPPSARPAPTLAQCFARNDSATGTTFSSADANAVRLGAAAAVPHDVLRLAGTCNGVTFSGGTSQTVVITRPLILVGGFSNSDWFNSYPITQPTTLDAQDLGRVISASADITLAELTVQHGTANGAAGGGIWAGGNLTLIGDARLISNTALVSTTLSAPQPLGLGQPQGSGPDVPGEGGGASVRLFFALYKDLPPRSVVLYTPHDLPNGAFPLIAGNHGSVGGGFSAHQGADLNGAYIINNTATQQGGGGNVVGDFTADQLTLRDNHSDFYAGGVEVALGNTNLTHVTLDGNSAGDQGGGLVQYGDYFTMHNGMLTNNTSKKGGALNLFSTIMAINASYFAGNGATLAGDDLYGVGAPGTVVNSFFSTSNLVDAGADMQFLSLGSQPAVEAVSLSTFVNIHIHLAARSAAQPLAGAAAITPTAIYASGVSVLITDTILSGFNTDLATDSLLTSTIHGDYNLFSAAPVLSGTGLITGSHSLVGNPLFADAQGHLSLGSPAINHGIDIGVNTDLDGNPRPSGGAFDIGAYEFQTALNKLFLPLLQR